MIYVSVFFGSDLVPNRKFRLELPKENIEFCFLLFVFVSQDQKNSLLNNFRRHHNSIFIAEFLKIRSIHNNGKDGISIIFPSWKQKHTYHGMMSNVDFLCQLLNIVYRKYLFQDPGNYGQQSK